MTRFKAMGMVWLAMVGLAAVTGTARAATFTFTGAAGSVPSPNTGDPTNWSDARNWSPQGVPGTADTAVINDKDVRFDGTVTVAGLTLGGANAFFHGNRTGPASTVGSVYVTGTFNWSGGLVSPSTVVNVPAGAQVLISGTNPKRLDGVLNNAGTATWTGTGNLVVSEEASGARFTNAGTLDIQNNAILETPRAQFGPAVFTNTGTINKTTSTGLAKFGHVRFTSSGTINVNLGTLEVRSLVTTSGPINVAAGALLNLADGTYRFNTGTALNGAGKVRVFNSENTTGSGGAFIEASGVINLASTLEFSAIGPQDGRVMIRTTGTSLTINGTGTFNWLGGKFESGTLNIGSGIKWNIGGNTDKLLSSVVVNNAGTATWTGTGDITHTDATLTNTGTFDINTDADIGLTFNFLTFNNRGTLNKSGGTGLTQIGKTGSVTFNNSGTVNVNSGELEINCINGAAFSGPFNIASGKVLTLRGGKAGGELVLNSGTLFQGAGKVKIGQTGQGDTVDIRGGAPFKCLTEIVAGRINEQANGATFNVSGTGPVNWLTGEIAGVLNVAANTPFNISGDDINRRMSAVFNNSGNITWTGTGPIRLDGTFNNKGSFTAQNNAELGGVFTSGTFNNSGTFVKQTGTGTTQIGNGAGLKFNNSGTVYITSGTLSVPGTYTQTAGGTFLSNATLEVANPLLLQRGTLGGTGSITGDVNNSGGSVAPGLSPGKINQTGNFAQSAGGTLKMELNGATPGTGYDQINVVGTVALGGALSLTAGFSPPAGSAFAIITNDGTDAVTGTFSNAAPGATVAAGSALFRINYNGGDGNDVVLTNVKPTVSINDVAVTEGGLGTTTTARFTVTLSEPVSQTVSVKFNTVGVTATAPGDYDEVPLTTLAFSAGQTSKNILVTVRGDALDEIDEIFRVVLTAPSLVTITDGVGQGLINDDDPPPTLAVSDVSVAEGGAAVFNVTLSAPSAKSVRVNFSTANVSATAGADYTAQTGAVTFAPGQTSQTISVATLNDLLDEANETFFVNLSSPSNATIADGQGQGTIVDDDGPAIVINNPASVTEGNGSTVNAVFTVTLSAPSPQSVTVNFAVSGFTATAGSDFVAQSGSVTFAPGETSKTITVVIIGDTVAETTEVVLVNLSSPVGGLIADGVGAVYILDNDSVAVAGRGIAVPLEEPSE